MVKRVNGDGAGFGCLVMLIQFSVICGLFYALSLWTDRNLEFYLSKAKGVAVEVPQWLSLIVSVVLNGVALVLNIVGELIRLVIE